MTSEAAIMDLEPATDVEPDAAGLALLRARDGDRSAFEELVRSHERLVFGTAKRLLHAAEDAEDIAQEVFLRLYNHLERLDPARPLASWLYRVTVNACHNLGRYRRSRPTVDLGDVAAEGIRAVGPDPAANAEIADEHRMVAKGLQTLTHKEREAMVLHDLEELSTHEVATALGVSETTVRTHLCRARQKMRAFRQQWHRRTTS